MFDFIINMVADIAEIFIDLWVDKAINRKKKSESCKSVTRGEITG